jgi:uncharacterized protein YjiS (DUF1127 family)
MSTDRRQGPRGPLNDSDLYQRLYAFGLQLARLLRAVAMRRAGQRVVQGVAVMLRRGGDMLWTWQNRYNARRHMAELDARLLDDVGLRREDIARAASKPFWRI